MMPSQEKDKLQRSIRRLVILLGLALILTGLAPMLSRALAADEPGVKLDLDTSQIGPRQIEDVTEEAITREYAAAWHNLEAALAENRADLLEKNFIGQAQEKFADQIEAQKKSGLKTRFVDRGHTVKAVFYSPEGSAIQLKDTAKLEMQVLDGNDVIYSKPVERHYVAIMSVTGSGWKVRVLESGPDQ